MKAKETEDRSKYVQVAGALRTAMTLILSVCLLGVGSPSADAHNIDVAKARDKAREYARQKVADPNRAYEHFTTDCLAAFPGHNHYVRCTIFYTDENRSPLCKERIEVYLEAHTPSGGSSYNMFLKHTSTKEC